MRIIEFSDSHLVGNTSPKMEALLDVVAQDPPDMLVGNGDIVDLWVEREDVIAESPTVKRLEELTRDVPTVMIIGNHDFDVDAIERMFPFADVTFNMYADGFWFEHGHLRDVIWQGWPIIRPIFDTHPEWSHLIFRYLYQPWRERLDLNPGNQKEREERFQRVFRMHTRAIWLNAVSFADRAQAERGIVIGHTHASSSWVTEFQPALWDAGSIRDDGTYLVIEDGVPALQQVELASEKQIAGAAFSIY